MNSATAEKLQDLPRGFHALTVADVRRETDDATSVAFSIPAGKEDIFSFRAGQYLTLLREFDGEALRRPYSVCVSPDEGELRVCVKKLPGGRMSSFVNDELKVGDQLAVMEPNGRFTLETDANGENHYVGIAGGSGITPVLSIVRTVLRAEPKSSVTLLYGNRGVNDIIFRRKIAELKDLYLGRFNVMHVLAEGDNDVELLSGMLTSEKVEELVSTFLDATAVDGYFICGPGPMMDGADAALKRLGVAKERVKIESFGAAAPTHRGAVICDVEDDVNAAQATVIVGGSRKQVKVPRSGNVLDAALAAKMDLPFACKGGVCCTCKARLVEGEVEMAVNYGLEDDEIERGFILTCQARPLTDKLVVDYDAI
ncbi:MAG: 1,2-phenylacetyl-CoA epoxidase subunit PaaE [Granulosicoccaceae bacterium]